MEGNLGKMGNILKTNPIGIDVVVHNAQKKLIKLADKWNIDLIGYPRCYILINATEQKTIEHFEGGIDYSGTLIFAEENKFFFNLAENVEQVSDSVYSAVLELYFVIDTKKCYPNIKQRADEEVRRDVLNVLNTIPHFGQKKVIVTNIDKVFNRFNNRISKNYEYEYTDDMQGYHCFKVLIPIPSYNLNDKLC